MLGFLVEPSRNVLDKIFLRQRPVKQRLEFRFKRRAIDRARLLDTDAANGLFLNEFALQRKQGLSRVVPRLKFAHLGADSEQLAQKILDMRRQIDHQIGLKPARKSSAASVFEPRCERGIYASEIFNESRVQTDQSLTDIQILE